MKLILIPGMDGTGLLFEPLIQSAPAGFELVSLPLLQDPEAGYVEQANYIIEHLGQEPAILLAESYSGMVAYTLLKMRCPNIQHVVFVASFITCPSRLARLASYFPIALLKSGVLPKAIVARALFGQYATQKLTDLFYKSIDGVSNEVLSQRIAQVSSLREPDTYIDVPCSYIRPKGDMLVSKSSIEPFQRLCKKLNIFELEGTHFVLQTNPEGCWRVIQSVIEQEKIGAG